MVNAPRPVTLSGPLGRRFGEHYSLAVASPAEAITALCAQIPGLKRELCVSHSRGVEYAVFVDGRNISEQELTLQSPASEIKIVPVIVGAGGKNGVLQTIVGVVLVVVGAVLTAWGYGAIGQPMIKFGYALALGGVAQMLAPQPKGVAQDKGANKASYSFNGPVNTQAQGNPVPVLYGELIVGSAVISAGIEARDQSVIPSWSDINSPTGGSGGIGDEKTFGGGSPGWRKEWELTRFDAPRIDDQNDAGVTINV